MICAWIETSSAVVGSSATMSCGSAASASAMTTRWRMPPESLPGYSPNRFSGAGIFTAVSSWIAVSLAFWRSIPSLIWSDSVICLPIFMTGLSDVIGSWKTMASSEPHNSR